MMNKEHQYLLSVVWTGNTGQGTAGYRSYERSYTVSCQGKPVMYGSSDPAFRGDRQKYNPEEWLVASLASCHMLWYLHLCAAAGVVVVSYLDQATGIMQQTANGGGRFKEVVLNPVITVSAPGMIEQAKALHSKANELCFIANSVNFPVAHRAEITVAHTDDSH